MTFNVLLYAMVGGIGSTWGPLAGTFIVFGLSQVLQVVQDYHMIVFGAALVLLIIYLPQGLAGVVAKTRRRTEPAPVARVAEELW
jgi:branched-chain amino acid transport system permease protein